MKKCLLLIGLFTAIVFLSCRNPLLQKELSSASRSVSTLGNGLVAHWDMNEKDTTVISNQVGLVHGTAHGGVSHIIGPNGLGNSLLFDGIDDYVDVPSSLVNTAQSFTVSAWVQPHVSTHANQAVIALEANRNSVYMLQRTSDNHWAFVASNRDAYWGHRFLRAQAVDTVVPGQWYHLVGVNDSVAGQMRLYVNGVLVQEIDEWLTWTSYGHTLIGRARWNYQSADHFRGAIDEVKVYNRALHHREVHALSGNPDDYRSPELLARFSLDESRGTRIENALGANHGRAYGGLTAVPNRRGERWAQSFDGRDDYIDIPAPLVDTTSSFTVSAWAKVTSDWGGYKTVLSQDGSQVSGFYLQRTQDNRWAFSAYNQDNSSSAVVRAKSRRPALPEYWYHLVGVYDDDDSKLKLYVNGELQQEVAGTIDFRAQGHTVIGRAKWNGRAVDYFHGQIDDVELHRRVLTESEIETLYGSPLIGQWSFDETFRSQIGGNHGRMIGGLRWVDGLIAKARRLDGAHDRVEVPSYGHLNTTESYTVSVYAKVENLEDRYQVVLSQEGERVSGFYLEITDGDHWAFSLLPGDSTNTQGMAKVVSYSRVVPNIWYHVVGVYDSEQQKVLLYVNGEYQGETSYTHAWPSRGAIHIGAAKWNSRITNYFEGVVDEVRIYKKALNISEVVRLYQEHPSVPDHVYLMAWFANTNDAHGENMHYAFSTDALNWNTLIDSQGNPRVVFDAYARSTVRMRDPYMQFVNGKYHLVHTWGWDNKKAFHWESTDGIHWTGANGGRSVYDGQFQAVPVSNTAPNAWAPEFFYDGSQFYVFWTSRDYDLNGNNQVDSDEEREKIFYRTTTDWRTFSEPALLFDPGFAVIDLTVIQEGDTIYGYYKTEHGAHNQRHILKATGQTLIELSGTTDILPSVRGVEGPQIIRTNEGDDFILYYDYFADGGYWGASTSTDMNRWTSISTEFPPNARHGSVLSVPRRVMTEILRYHGQRVPTGWF
ncbi:MAG: hypothetical protein MI717_12810 [Spirochaetales bacterium]|nr:hypothetical protein [Spirochaetales bacterium]